MPFFSSFTGSFSGGRRKPISIGVGGGGGASGFSSTTLTYTLDNPNAFGTSELDFFGRSVGITDTHAIVGAFGEDDAGGTTSGKAYIYDLSDGSLLYTLDNPNAFGTSADDRFGFSSAISTNYAIVGAWNEDDATQSPEATGSGKAYIFNLSNGSLAYTLDNPNAYGTATSDTFGHSVSISDNYAIVSAVFEDDAAGIDSGKAYIYDLSDGSLTYTLDNPNPISTSDSDWFGWVVAISTNYAIVTAPAEDEADLTGQSGKAYIYDLSDGSLLYTLDNPNAYNTPGSDFFGRSADITDTHAIVGAYSEDDAGGNSSGKAYIFDLSDGSLLYTLDNPNAYDTSNNDQFAYSVAINDSYAIVGALLEDDAGGADSGKAYIFDLSDGSLVNTLDNPNAYDTSAADKFGSGVAISSSYAIVAALNEDDAGGVQSGKAYIFKAASDVGGGGGADFSVATNFASALSATPIDATNWPSGVFMSADKSTLVLPDSDDSLASFNGAIHIYSNDNAGNWDYVEKIVPPSQTPGANGGYASTAFGVGVALSTDGSKMAVSGYGHGVNGASQNQGGAIWVLERQGDGTYTELDRIDRPISDDTNLGAYIDISGDGNYIAVAGKDKDSPNHAANTVYKFNSGTSTYEKMSSEVTSSGSNVSVDWNTANAGSNTRFNSAISDDGLYVVIGNPEANNWGNAYGFAGVGFYDGADWGQQQELRPASLNPPFVDDYGVSVDINSDGSVIAVGAYRAYDSTNATSVGAVYIWRRTGSTWTEEAKIYTPDGVARTEPRWFGSTVKLLPDGNTLFANSVYTVSNPSATGKIYVYTHSGGTWSLAETIDTGYTDNYPNSPTNFEVSRDGSLVAITAYDDPSRLQFFETTGGPYYSVGGGGGGGGGAVSWSGSFPVTATANTFVYDNAILAQDGATETLVTDAFMHPDNNIILLCGNSRDLVYQIDLSSASDISTASYTGTNFDTTSQTATPNFINFSGDGTKMYIYSQKLNPQPGLFEYDLSTAWDITTATFNQSNTSLNDADYSYSIQFNDDGTKIYTASAITETIVYEFSLSSAYDISTINSTATATFDYSTIAEITDPTSLRSMKLSSDGTKIYFNINSQGEIHECTLGTAWDLSTISYSATADISATDSSPYVLFFNSDGSEMYTSNAGTDTISQYTMS